MSATVGRPPKDLSQRTFGSLQPQRYKGKQVWECLCLLDGTVFDVPTAELTSGRRTSCGCDVEILTTPNGFQDENGAKWMWLLYLCNRDDVDDATARAWCDVEKGCPYRKGRAAIPSEERLVKHHGRTYRRQFVLVSAWKEAIKNWRKGITYAPEDVKLTLEDGKLTLRELAKLTGLEYDQLKNGKQRGHLSTVLRQGVSAGGKVRDLHFAAPLKAEELVARLRPVPVTYKDGKRPFHELAKMSGLDVGQLLDAHRDGVLSADRRSGRDAHGRLRDDLLHASLADAEALAARLKAGRAKLNLEQAIAFLRPIMERGGDYMSNIKIAAKRVGIKESALLRAKKNLFVVSSGIGFQGKYWWHYSDRPANLPPADEVVALNRKLDEHHGIVIGKLDATAKREDVAEVKALVAAKSSLVKPTAPTAAYCIVRPGTIRWNGEVNDVQPRFINLLEKLLQADGEPLSFEDAAGPRGTKDRSIQNAVSTLNELLSTITWPHNYITKDSHIVRV